MSPTVRLRVRVRTRKLSLRDVRRRNDETDRQTDRRDRDPRDNVGVPILRRAGSVGGVMRRYRASYKMQGVLRIFELPKISSRTVNQPISTLSPRGVFRRLTAACEI